MRTFLKIVVTLVILVGAFVAYVVFQPASAVQQAATRPAPLGLQRSAEGLLIGEGENAWVRQFDDEGRLASRFRAEKWEPQKNGLVRVIRPEAELVLKGGKDKDGKDKPRPLVRIRGDDGEVVLQGLPDAVAADKPLAPSQGAPASGTPGGRGVGPTQPPSSGRLNGAVIEVFESEDAPAPRVTLRTNNIVFDNDTFRISTESYRAEDGSTVTPDQVPVSVTGPDFEFFGRGLTVRWNELEERLDLLRIAHGDRLVIKNVEAFSTGGLPLSVPAATSLTSAAAASETAPMADMLASADRGAAVALATADRRPRGAVPAVSGPATKPARRKKDGDKLKDDEQPPYRAAFNDDVRIVQGEEQLATAKLMNIDFLLGQRKPEKSAARPASTQPGREGAAASQPATDQGNAATQPTDASAFTQPATAPAPQPITVYWTGELTVTPAPVLAPAAAPATLPAPAPFSAAATAAEEPLPPGEARVELIGAPAVLSRDLLDVQTARFVYRTDGRLTLDNSAEFPLVLISQRRADGPDTTVTTEGFTYSRGDHVAVLRGQSRVVAPIGSGEDASDHRATADGAAKLFDASWRDTGTFRLVGEREDELWVEHAAFAGDVDVKAPQGIVRSQHLELSFDPPLPKAEATTRPATNPTTRPADPALAQAAGRREGRASGAGNQPNLRRVLATDGVYCELFDVKQGKRLLECQRLALDTARSNAGELYPRVVDASGAVHAASAEQELNAGHVLLQLRPAKRPAATQPDDAGADADPNATQPAPFKTREHWVLADAGAAGLPGALRPEKDEVPAFELESMTATDAVRVAAKDGGVATGKRLVVTVGDDGTPRVELTGDPARVEHAHGSGTLTGPRIEVDPKTGVAHVVGPGTLRAVQREEKDSAAGVTADAVAAGAVSALAPTRPIEVTWADGAEVRGADDRIDITGAVSLWITDTDGSVRTATAGRVRVDLAPKPAEALAREAPAEPKHDARDDNPAGGAPLAQSMNMDLFKDKEVAQVHLYDDAVINSKLTANDGSMLRQFHLKAQAITYDARSRQLTVPGPGQMLVELHEPPAVEGEPKQARSGPGGADDAAAFASGNGVTAFQWAQSLEYDESAGHAVMDGSVIVSHQPDNKSDPRVRLDADTLTAVFEPRQRDPGRSEKTIASGEARDAQELQLRSIDARGHILIAREGAELSAHEISYDPATEWVIARGTPRNPAAFTAPGGAGTMRAGALWLNTRTWQVTVKDVNTRAGVSPR